MNKSEFIDAVADKAELTRAAAARVVDAIFDTAQGAISEAVHAAGSLSIPGFGKFTRRTRAARTGRNPRTGAEIKIPERTTVGFSAGRGLKEQRSTSRRKSSSASSRSGGSSGGSSRGSSSRSSGGSSSSRSTASRGSASKSSGGGSSSSRSGSKSSSGGGSKSSGGGSKSSGGGSK